MTDRLQAAREALHVDQYGEPWLVRERNGDRWALGFDDDSIPVLRQIFDGEIVIDYGLTRAVRKIEALALLQSGPDTSRQSSETAERIIDAIAFTIEEGSGSDWGANRVIDRTQSITNIESILSAAFDAAAEGQARAALNELLDAIDAGTVKIDGPMIDGGGDPEIGYERWPWAGEWLHHARKATGRYLFPAPPVSASKPEGA